jgi:2Fe-2S ferredoxin
MATIVFTFEDKTIHQPIQIENVTVDQSILDIAEDNEIHLNHNCGGVCAGSATKSMIRPVATRISLV